MSGWALDRGTADSRPARRDERTPQPALLDLAAICRLPEGDDPLEAPRMVPSSVYVLESLALLDRRAAWPPLERIAFVGRRALIGRQALEANRDAVHPSFVPAFKAALAAEALRPLARVGRRRITAREAAGLYLRELLAEARKVTGERIRDVVVTTPVSAFETYRAEVQRLLTALGVRRVRFVDEPVAAALGYGLSLTHERSVLVVDIGGGRGRRRARVPGQQAAATAGGRARGVMPQAPRWAATRPCAAS